MSKKITMLSLQASSNKSDFICMKDMIRNMDREIDLEDFFGNLQTKEKNLVRSVLHEAAWLRENGGDWVGIEGFLPEEFLSNPKGNKRYLLLEPFDYLFQVKWNASNCLRLLNGYTHVIVPSDYWEKKIRANIGKSDVQIVSDCKFPFLEMAADAEFAAQNREQLEKRLPQVKGKKLIYINLTGRRANPGRNDYTETDMYQLLIQLPEEYMIVTNSLNLRYAARHLESSYRNRFIFVKGNDMWQELTVTSDYLLSNNAYSCAIFASLGKGYAPVQFSDNYFEKYLSKNYSQKMLTNSSELYRVISSMTKGEYKIPEIEELKMTGEKSVVKGGLTE